MFGERLRSARKMAGLSMQALADKIDNVVTKQAMSKYEKNLMKPDGKILSALSKVMEVPPDYFFQAPKYRIEKIEFRKKFRLNVTDQNRIIEFSKTCIERYEELHDLLGISCGFKLPIENRTVRDFQDIDRIVSELRYQWDLGEWALLNVVELLENRGVRVFEIDAPEEFDGLSGWADAIPLIIVNKSLDRDPCRKRFTVLHEFVHLVLDFQVPEKPRLKEKLCHYFAGAFLMPHKVFIREFGAYRKGITLNELVRIKENFGISIQAIMARAWALGMVSAREYRQFNIWINRRGYRKNEPGLYCGAEKARRFESLISRAVTEEIITMSKAAVLSGKSLAAFRRSFNAL